MSDIPLLLQAAILGLLQGLTEFFPISSSAHLVTVPTLLGWPYLGKAFDVALHLGTLIALVVVFKKDIKSVLRSTWAVLSPGKPSSACDRHLVGLFVVACLPVALSGLLLERIVEERFGTPFSVAIMMITWGVLLEAADREGPKLGRGMHALKLPEALVVGLVQALAIFPGVSRSGATITACLYLGLERREAARFSFLLSIPVVCGAALLKLLALLKEPYPAELLGASAVGIAVSSVVGYLCLRFLFRHLGNGRFRPFVVYRLVFGLLLLGWLAFN